MISSLIQANKCLLLFIYQSNVYILPTGSATILKSLNIEDLSARNETAGKVFSGSD